MRTSKQHWIDTGILLLRQEGEYALTIERLCKQLEISKGSFYHHFGDLKTYQTALLEWWETELTSKPIELAKQELNPQEQAQKLGEIVRQLDHRLDFSIRAWGLHDNQVKQYVHRVDQRRLESLEVIYSAMEYEQAHILAQLEYTIFIGEKSLGLMAANGQLQMSLEDGLAVLRQKFQPKTSQTDCT